MKMLILGENGMLGQMAYRYFGRHPDFVVSVLQERYDAQDHGRFIKLLNACNADVVLNCIGRINQYKANLRDIFELNAQLPCQLAVALKQETTLVHPSTDCVFKGEKVGMYLESDVHDAVDAYGISKSMGEIAIKLRPNTLIIRTSIIGPDSRSGGLGLMAWLMRQSRGSEINGYTNHYWNGITTLEWCRTVESNLVEISKCSQAKFIQPGLAKPISKYELLTHMNSIFERGVVIRPHSDAHEINRSLKPKLVAPPIESQLKEILTWCI